MCHLLKFGVNPLLENNLEVPNNLPQIYVPSLVPRIKIKLDLQGKSRERQKVLYQAVSYYMIDSSVNFYKTQYKLDMADIFASFGRNVFLHV
ncbi:unnamed protein product [Rotaria sordida]|uniref:Uncharacterized protein n=1 Tax=Rotaria sordida TaxID=392033 RepID=A0A819M5G3_9BILA|nr:unnamed protein product [Rotaria sordida]